jgi:hypothetical protein
MDHRETAVGSVWARWGEGLLGLTVIATALTVGFLLIERLTHQSFVMAALG